MEPEGSSRQEQVAATCPYPVRILTPLLIKSQKRENILNQKEYLTRCVG